MRGSMVAALVTPAAVPGLIVSAPAQAGADRMPGKAPDGAPSNVQGASPADSRRVLRALGSIDTLRYRLSPKELGKRARTTALQWRSRGLQCGLSSRHGDPLLAADEGRRGFRGEMNN